MPTGARTISASAFKRPQPLPSNSGDNYGGLPDPRRGLPAAPTSQPQPQQGAYGSTPVGGVFPGSVPTPQSQLPNPYQTSEPAGYPSQPPQQQQQQPHHPHAHHRISRDLPPPPPGAAAARPETEYDYGFDLSAYEQGSPLSSEFPGGAGQRVEWCWFGGCWCKTGIVLWSRWPPTAAAAADARVRPADPNGRALPWLWSTTACPSAAGVWPRVVCEVRS
ncbi:hypothetical protein FA13DRAFT_169543 [Coprinellus micaceus]|uniref:Uncharacterized protein n=1 Tax=Coprinellus micaceus TaxID=71717 RepID=A0A4Y7SGU7_COPMI|nr:hypothetical protein FA13DRAFT_169543 [Coprinellus micaceus]